MPRRLCISRCRLFPDYGNDVHTAAISGDVLPSVLHLADSDATQIAVHPFSINAIWEMRATMIFALPTKCIDEVNYGTFWCFGGFNLYFEHI